MARRESKGFVQLEWVCPNCDGRNPGSIKTCGNCGAPQPENVKFQRAANEKIVTDEKLVQAAKAGADIHCGFCGTRNPANAVTCSQCGGDIKEGKARQAGQILQAAPTPPKIVTCTNCGTENPGSETTCSKCGSLLPRAAAPRLEPAQVKAAASQKDTEKKKPNWLLFGGIGAFLLTCCLAILFLFVFPSKSVQGTVTDVRWQTSVPMQEVQAVHYSNERGSAPSDAYNVSCHTESQEVCEEKTIDRGNGFAEVVQECHTESDEYCSYTVDEWKTIQTYDLSGNDLFPVYENPSFASDQRLGSASEDLTVYFSTSDGQQTYSPGSISEFQQFQIGSTWTLKMNVVGGITSVER
ncbi:MAG: zinc ribbon domain-containing protein [Anaerolineales bacterium]|nr:zinc ribbon domain-containing protein [Anaerolineales bacterium]